MRIRNPNWIRTFSAAATWTRLESCVAQVSSITELALKTARRELQPESEQNELVVEEYWLQHIDQDQLDALTEEILEELERRLCTATCQSSWPVTHRVADTANKTEFFRRLCPLYQNNRKLFGALVTPVPPAESMALYRYHQWTLTPTHGQSCNTAVLTSIKNGCC